MIKVYPSKLPGEPMETHEIEGQTTIEDWLSKGNPKYVKVADLQDHGLDAPPISVTVNGKIIEPLDWSRVVITDDDNVEIRREGKDPATVITAVIVAVVSAAASYFLRPSIPDLGTSQGGRGDSLALANAQGNKIKIGDVIPEQSGKVRFYPDLISQPRRWFSGPKEQSLSLLMTYGVGEFDVEDRRIEKTGFDNLNINYQEFGPGQNVTSHVAHENWYTAREVGSTSGSSGIELLSNSDASRTWEGSLTFSGRTISGDEIPVGWDIGSIIDITMSVDVEVVDDMIEGTQYLGYFDYLYPIVGEYLKRLDEELQPTYRIRSYSQGSGSDKDTLILETYDNDVGEWVQVVNPEPGNYTMTFVRVSSVPGAGVAQFRITDLSSGPTSVTLEMLLNGEVVSGWQGWTEDVTTSTADVELDLSNNVGIWSNSFEITPANVTTSLIEWDIFAPAGLCELGETSGNIYRLSRQVQMRYRRAGTEDAWTTETRTLTGATRDQLGWSFQTQLYGEMRPEVQVRRVQGSSNDIQIVDDLEWFGAKSRLPAATSYNDVTVLAMTLVGSNEVAARTENRVNVLATRRLPGVQGEPMAATRSISRFVKYVANDAGYDDEQIDMDELARLGDIWDSRSDYYDYRTGDGTTVKVAINKALRPGFAQMSSTNGILVPVRDEPKTEYTQMYTPQNMLSLPKRKYSAKLPGSADGVNVRYVDGETWTEEVVECRLPGDQGYFAEEITLDGVTDRTRAWRVGMRRRREIEYRRWEYSFPTETDAFNSEYGDFISMGDDIPSYGKSALVESAASHPDGALLTLSEKIEFTPGEPHVIAWRRDNGTLSGPYDAEPGPTARQVVAVGSTVPVVRPLKEPPHAQFGTLQKWTFPTIVSMIDPQGLHRVNVTGVNYDERVYADDDNEPTT